MNPSLPTPQRGAGKRLGAPFHLGLFAPYLRRGLLPLAQALWIAVVVIDLLVFVPGALLYDHDLHLPCPTPTNSAASCTAGQLGPAALRQLAHVGLSVDAYAALMLALMLLVTAVLFATGALIAWRKWRDAVGLLASLILITLGANGSAGVFQGAESQLLPSLAPHVASVLNALSGAVFLVQWPALGAFLLTFPTGHFAPRRTWPLVGFWITNYLAFALGPPPAITLLSVVITFGSVLLVQAYRYRRIDSPLERQQTKWLVYLLAVAVILDTIQTVVLALLPGDSNSASASLVVSAVGAIGGAVVFLLIGLAITIALLFHRLYDIDQLINRTLVYGALTALVVGGYVLIVGYLGALFQTHGSLVLSLLATSIVAVLFQPARQALQRGANRLLYGDRDDPYAAIAHLGRQLESALAPDTILTTVATTIREALKLPYAAIVLVGEGKVVAVGEARGTLLRLPLTHAGEAVGELLLSPRTANEGWTAAERRLLIDLAHSAGGAVQAVRLNHELQRSREGLVMAREEERRRLRRDLHDELAPTLAALALTAATAADLIPPEAARLRRLIGELQAALRDSAGQVRRLAHDLRPPTLDELGLIAAIRERAQQVSGRVEVRVEAPDRLPPLSAAVEVATYRIVQEALMNVLRHAHARQCIIRLAVSTTETGSVFVVIVEDDGVGPTDDATRGRHGVGLRSMQERAAELGGTFTIERVTDRGTRIRAQIPLEVSREEVADGSAAPTHR
jgi:signal transduction histidine kinase